MTLLLTSLQNFYLRMQNFQSQAVTVGTCRQAAKRRLRVMQAQAHNAPIMSVPRHDKPATRLLTFAMTHRVREEELNTTREKNITENAGCFLGHRKFAFLKELKFEWNSVRHAGILCLRMRKAVPSAIWPIGLAGWYKTSDIRHTKGCSHTLTHRSIEVTYEGELKNGRKASRHVRIQS